jgi:PAS domain S-box-containing protein
LPAKFRGFHIENRYLRKSGESLWVRKSVSLVRSAEGEPRWIISLVEDVTERKQAEDALKQQSQLIELSFEPILVWDRKSGIIEWNHGCEELYGYSREQALGKTSHELLHIQFPVSLAEFEDHFFREGNWSGELHHFTLEGRQVIVESRHQLLNFGERQLVLETNRDITEHKHAEEALLRSEARWNAAIENFGEAAIIATETEQIIYWNPAARRMHGFSSAEEGIGGFEKIPDTFQLWTLDGQRQLLLDEWPMRRIKRGERVKHWELRLRRPDQGWEKILSYSGTMVEVYTGERLIFLSAYDLTEQRRVEYELQEADRQKNEFLAMLGHELRNPLTPISGIAQLLGTLPQNGTVLAKAAEMLTRNVNHITHIVDDLLDVSRITRGLVVVDQQPIELGKLLNDTAESVQSFFTAKQQTLDLHLPAQPITLNGDPVRLTQVFSNLLTNSSKYTGIGGRISLKANHEGN